MLLYVTYICVMCAYSVRLFYLCFICCPLARRLASLTYATADIAGSRQQPPESRSPDAGRSLAERRLSRPPIPWRARVCLSVHTPHATRHTHMCMYYLYNIFMHPVAPGAWL